MSYNFVTPKPCEPVYRCTGCPTGITLLQTRKVINGLVRIPSSLYTMSVGALNVYNNTNNTPAAPYGVNWNQMSDRKIPHVQRAYMSLKSSKSLRPGAMTPGGVGCDIKHNSYDRYLARIKGKAPLRNSMVSGCIC